MDKVVGVLGGMGPGSTIDFLNKIVEETEVMVEQDHLRVLIDNNPKIPCRVSAILNGEESPLSSLVTMAKNLENQSVDFLVMPCNTAHYFLNDLIEKINLEVIDMIDETIKYLNESNFKFVGLIGTDALLKTGLYQKEINHNDIDVLTPDDADSQAIMESIFKFKKGKVGSTKVDSIIHGMFTKGVDTVILACSELPVLISDELLIHCIDPTRILAKKTVKYAKNNHI